MEKIFKVFHQILGSHRRKKYRQIGMSPVKVHKGDEETQLDAWGETARAGTDQHEEKAQGALSMYINTWWRDHKEYGASFFSVVLCDGTIGYRQKTKQKKFHLNVNVNTFFV